MVLYGADETTLVRSPGSRSIPRRSRPVTDGAAARARSRTSYAVDGRQYVVGGTGTGGNASRWSAMTPELRPSSGNYLFVFALP